MSLASPKREGKTALEAWVDVPLGDAASRYLRAHGEGSPLYPAGSLASSAATERRALRLDAWPGDRPGLARWLREQNAPEILGTLHPSQAENLSAAARPDALFVLTGQRLRELPLQLA